MPYKNIEVRKRQQKIRRSRQEYKDKYNTYRKEWRHRKKINIRFHSGRPGLGPTKAVRLQCISHYSNGQNCCACCGESHIEFLAIDHINGGGSKHRKEVRKKFPTMYHFLIREGFPDGYRILCHNCNLSKGFYKYCPHERVVNNRV